MQPRMFVVAGPPGSGKSTAFPARSFCVDAFNADDRAAELNHGSYQGISLAIRTQVAVELQRFVEDHIKARRSFAVETTLRTAAPLEQAKHAHSNGFYTSMHYICVERLEQNIERIAARADSGGHAAPPSLIRTIREASLKNLARAIQTFDRLRIYDNSAIGQQPKLVFEARDHAAIYLARSEEIPQWLEGALQNTNFKLTQALRDAIEKHSPPRIDLDR